MSIHSVFNGLLFLTFSVAVYGQGIKYGAECKTLEGIHGFCVDILSCSSLSVELEKSRQGLVSIQSVLQHRCGTQGRDVCCPISDLRADLDAKRELLPPPKTCGKQVVKKIIGGKITKIGEFPWIVQLWYTDLIFNKSATICAGALINGDHVVTAAHCVNHSFLKPTQHKLERVRLGEWNTATAEDCDLEGTCAFAEPVEIPVAEVIEHEHYDRTSPSKQNDIAIIRLAWKVRFSEYICPICLPFTSSVPLLVSDDAVLLDDVTLTATGWGKTETSVRSDVKLKVDVKGVNNEMCDSVYRKFDRFINKRQICAGGNAGEDTCSGDSGAPLMGYYSTNVSGTEPLWYLAGVVSYGPVLCGTLGQPGVYSRISEYTDWILSRLK